MATANRGDASHAPGDKQTTRVWRTGPPCSRSQASIAPGDELAKRPPDWGNPFRTDQRPRCYATETLSANAFGAGFVVDNLQNPQLFQAI